LSWFWKQWLVATLRAQQGWSLLEANSASQPMDAASPAQVAARPRGLFVSLLLYRFLFV